MRRKLKSIAYVLALAIVTAVFVLPLLAAGQPGALPEPRDPMAATAIKVVPLAYARAEELAYTLSLLGLPRVRIVAYRPTNSLIISGPPAEVEQLIDIIKPRPLETPRAPR
jgi:type II secretory pathway component GspD/PulD (secretin)